MIANGEAVAIMAMTAPFMPRLATLAVLRRTTAPSGMTMPAGPALAATAVTATMNLCYIVCGDGRSSSIDLSYVPASGCSACK